MRTLHVSIVSVALVISTALIGAAVAFGNRYSIEPRDGTSVVWKIDRLTGQAYGCEESEFGPFCIPAPDMIKHEP